jgi:hypothetical protein
MMLAKSWTTIRCSTSCENAIYRRCLTGLELPRQRKECADHSHLGVGTAGFAGLSSEDYQNNPCLNFVELDDTYYSRSTAAFAKALYVRGLTYHQRNPQLMTVNKMCGDIRGLGPACTQKALSTTFSHYSAPWDPCTQALAYEPFRGQMIVSFNNTGWARPRATISTAQLLADACWHRGNGCSTCNALAFSKLVNATTVSRPARHGHRSSSTGTNKRTSRRGEA